MRCTHIFLFGAVEIGLHRPPPVDPHLYFDVGVEFIVFFLVYDYVAWQDG